MVAGFFVMLLLQTRGPRRMGGHRLLRIGGPFTVFALPVAFFTGLFAALYMHRALRGSWGIDISLVPPPPGVPPGPNMLHLWFPWLLLLGFSLATAALAQLWASPCERSRMQARAEAVQAARFMRAAWLIAPQFIRRVPAQEIWRRVRHQPG